MAEGSVAAIPPGLERVATGVAGLDEVLNGGLVRGGLYLIGGRPGTGKTTLGNHIAFHHAAGGGIALYGTVLAEPHERMLAHLRGFRFFDPGEVARRVHYVSLYDELSAGGLEGALNLLRRLVREQRATLLLVDGASLFDDFAPSPVEFRRFTTELHTQMSVLGATTLLLSDYDSRLPNEIGAHVDGLILLEDESVGLRDVRLLHVVKLRGVNYLRGRHHFGISDAGVEVYPRLEATLARALPHVGPAVPIPIERRARHGFGVPGLDDMLRGGLLSGSMTLIMGAPGAGKTVTGLHFVAEGARRGERGLVVGFHETPERLLAKADALGLGLGEHVAADRVRILWHPPGELLLDAWAHEVLAAVAELRPARLFIDSLGELERLVIFPERIGAFLAALTEALREQDVTTVFVVEVANVVGAELEVPPSTFPLAVENAIMLRYVELRSQLRRLVSVLKMRDSDYDTSIREFGITQRGLEVADTFESAEAILTGVARLVGPADPGGVPLAAGLPPAPGEGGP